MIRALLEGPEGWPSGRRHSPAKGAYGPKPVSRVRIPPPPPVSELERQYICANILPLCSAPVAQLDRVLGYEPRGRAFESLRARQQRKEKQAFRPILGLAFCFSDRQLFMRPPASGHAVRRCGCDATRAVERPKFFAPPHACVPVPSSPSSRRAFRPWPACSPARPG